MQKVEYAYTIGDKKKSRPKKIADDLFKIIDTVSSEAGLDVTITSGGQDPNSPNRKGSKRHDETEAEKGGHAADVYFKVKGTDRILNPDNAEDLKILGPLMSKFIENGITGIGNGGNYMGSNSMFHIDNSSKHNSKVKGAFWGGKAQDSAGFNPALTPFIKGAKTKDVTKVEKATGTEGSTSYIQSKYGPRQQQAPASTTAPINTGMDMKRYKYTRPVTPAIPQEAAAALTKGAVAAKEIQADLPKEVVKAFTGADNNFVKAGQYAGLEVPFLKETIEAVDSRPRAKAINNGAGYAAPALQQTATQQLEIDKAEKTRQEQEVFNALRTPRPSIAEQAAPFVSNIINATRTLPSVPTPNLVRGVQLNRMDYGNERADVEKSVNANNKAFDNNYDAQTAAINRQYSLGERFEMMNTVNAAERNQNAQIANTKAQMNVGVDTTNAAKMDDFQKNIVDRRVLQDSIQSANLANASDKYTLQQNARRDALLEDQRLRLNLANDDKGLMYNFLTRNKQLKG